MTTDQNSAIDETVIEALRARSRRYDVVIDDELVLSVLPNGVKTWTWVYDDPSDPHRKTLGIYPDMSPEDAKKSLAAEKESYSRAAEFVIRDGRIESTTPSSQWPIIAGAAVAMIAVAVIALLMLGGDTDGDSDGAIVDDSSPFAATPTETELQLPTIGQSPATVEDLDSAVTDMTEIPDRIEDAKADSDTPVTALPAADTMANDITDVVDDTRPGDNGALATRLEQTLSETSPPAQPAATIDTMASDVTDVVDDTRPGDNDALATRLEQTLSQTSPPQPAATIDTSPPESTVAPQNDPQTPADASQAPAAVGTLIENLSSGLILDDRVARGYLTTAVLGREPVDDLGSQIVGDGSELQTYYFFTELRSLSGQRVRHRWLHRNRVVAEVPFNVGEAWRWRVYSSKTFIPSMSGQLHVQVLLEDDTVIYSLPFSYTP